MPTPPAFGPDRKLAQLCRRHGLPDGAGARYLPLLERSARQRADLRLRVVDFVDRELGKLAQQRAKARRACALRNEACLRAVAPLLHKWLPERGDSGLDLHWPR
ncbi:MAG: hypothetical protein IPK67_03955 [Planctomycetes bacterium]|nr:hypothetical protein [Planctomycetota bacterium]